MSTFIILTCLILLHELGHFLTARFFKIKVEEFGFGLPPKLIRLWKKGDTEYTLNLLPIGGFVRLFGEDGDLNLFEKLNPTVRKHSFVGKPAWQRSLVLLAGVAANLLIGILIFSFIYSLSGVPRVERNLGVVTQVVKGSPAELAGIKEGDAVLSIDGKEITTSGEFVDMVGRKKGEMVTFKVTELMPDGKVSENSRIVSAVPRVNPPAGEGALGIGISTLPIFAYDKKPWYLAPFYGTVEGVKESYAWAKEIVHGLGTLVGSIVKGQLPDGISGPVGVFKAGEKINKTSGLLGSLRFAAILSINLGIFNLLPFPGLDGGRLLFVGLERIIGRKRVNKYEGYIHTGGVLLLILLLLVITWKDIWG